VSRLIYVTGGARSGKSSFAERRAAAAGGEVTYLATAQPFDDEMRDRIARHRADRPAGWRTVEEPLDVPRQVEQLRSDVLLLDCLSLWVSNMLLADWTDEAMLAAADRLLAACAGVPTTILVTNEVGLGIVPDNALARRYRDAGERAAGDVEGAVTLDWQNGDDSPSGIRSMVRAVLWSLQRAIKILLSRTPFALPHPNLPRKEGGTKNAVFIAAWLAEFQNCTDY